jgi:hypothetical protein
VRVNISLSLSPHTTLSQVEYQTCLIFHSIFQFGQHCLIAGYSFRKTGNPLIQGILHETKNSLSPFPQFRVLSPFPRFIPYSVLFRSATPEFRFRVFPYPKAKKHVFKIKISTTSCKLQQVFYFLFCVFM